MSLNNGSLLERGIENVYNIESSANASDEKHDSFTFVKNQLLALNWRKDKSKRFGGNLMSNKADNDADNFHWLFENAEALFVTEKLLNEVYTCQIFV